MRPRTLLLALASAALAAGSLAAQTSPWTKQAPIPSAEAIFGVAPRSADELWCSSAPWPFSHDGQVAHTTNAGDDWEVTQLDTGGVLCLFFLDDLHGWAAGGAFRRTTDGGATWTKVNDWGTVYDLHFVDALHGWAGGNGGAAYRTTDGGLTWEAVSTPTDAIHSVWFQDQTHGWAVGGSDGRIVRTSDGGQTWTINRDTGEYLRTIQFPSPLEGRALGGDACLRSHDGGQSWTSSPLPQGIWAQAGRFFDELNGLAVGEGGGIARTTDGGASWTLVRAPSNAPRLWDVEYGDAQTVFCSGDAGVLMRSTDGGTTWSTIQSGAWGIARGLDVRGAELAWAACQGGEIVRSTDGGALWERHVVEGFGPYGSLWDVDFVTDEIGWTVGRVNTGNGFDGVVSGSTDGGITWQLQAYLTFSELLGVCGFDAQRAIAFGWGTIGGTLLRTTNGGASWQAAGPPQGTYRGADALDASTGWIAGTHLYKTTDAGASWTLQYTTPGPHLAAVSFADAQNGWASGFQNQLLHTSDGGQTWSQQDAGAPPGTALMGVWAVSPTTAWVAGWNGFVARTTDRGATWHQEPIPGAPDAYFEAVEFLDAERGWVAGDYGIFFRDPGGDCSGVASYCSSTPNSTGAAAEIGWSGTCVAAANDFTLLADPVPNQTFLFFTGPGPIEAPFGNGLRCVGGPVTRLFPAGTASGNVAQRQVDLASLGLSAGSTAYFQCWFRDPAAGGALFDTSNGLEVSFE